MSLMLTSEKSPDLTRLLINPSTCQVNSEDDEAPISEPDFSIDGGYIPRIVFVDSKGENTNQKESILDDSVS